MNNLKNSIWLMKFYPMMKKEKNTMRSLDLTFMDLLTDQMQQEVNQEIVITKIITFTMRLNIGQVIHIVLPLRKRNFEETNLRTLMISYIERKRNRKRVRSIIETLELVISEK